MRLKFKSGHVPGFFSCNLTIYSALLASKGSGFKRLSMKGA